MSLEEVVFTIISHAGDAKSLCFEALAMAKKGEFEKADALIKDAQNELYETHNIQNSMIQKEASGEKLELSLLLMHAEDHLMTAILAKDLIEEMIEIYRENKKYKEAVENDD
ncbi:PTS lactose/cellobiose transporter subunit IIA [Paratissierella segnis]|uniref:PTS lactose/cellobiose transporter subunit IIA n=1 Tax=Paratissierella segnis TaxID=2763679 RepID=A0A926IIE3_9FIRM|nr:PTS lactose/cellobiose transporter subunit IIA [Paratissierella segnis]MBC8586874.1 PTS lactose/cellobiose transporter subunit IIA [Paratissierella segnis]